MLKPATLLIGIDGGATEVKAHAATCDNLQQPTSFALRAESAARVYERLPDFTPLPVAEQLAQRDAGPLQLAPTEVAQGQRWFAAAADAVAEVAQACDAGAGTALLIGMGMPGLKTPDGRGISVINNGPRMPDFLVQLEAQLKQRGLELAAPIARLGSDADYCGLGEAHAGDGLFRDVQHAYYVGCGTGIADAMKLRGALVPFDAAKPWLQKSWQMPSALGPTFEKLVSASSLNRVYAELGTTPGTGAFPEVAALAGDPVASAWLQAAAMVLAELIFERLWTIKNGRPAAAHRGPAYLALQPEHPYRGITLERVIIGQRLGLLFADHRYQALFATPLERCLTRLIARTEDAGLRGSWLASGGGQLQPGRLVASKLRAAPALGAAVAAVQALRG